MQNSNPDSVMCKTYQLVHGFELRKLYSDPNPRPLLSVCTRRLRTHICMTGGHARARVISMSSDVDRLLSPYKIKYCVANKPVNFLWLWWHPFCDRMWGFKSLTRQSSDASILRTMKGHEPNPLSVWLKTAAPYEGGLDPRSWLLIASLDLVNPVMVL